MKIAITAAAVRCAAGTALVPPTRCYARPHDEASALQIPGVARVDGLIEDVRFPDDRKGSLAAAVLSALPRPHRDARVGLYLGTGLSSLTPDEVARDLYPHILGEPGSRHFDRVAIARDHAAHHPAPRRHQPERVTTELGKELGAIVTETSFSACAAAAQSILQAARAVHRGDVDIAYCGGHDSMLHAIGYLSFVVLGALSPTEGRPFDRQRDGFLIGEGAGMLALRREADLGPDDTVLGWIVGGGTSVDAYNVTHPHPEGDGAALAMRRALQDAQLSASDIDYVNAHGTGTPVGDLAECTAIHRVLGAVPVSSYKGAVGHTIAAAGAVELALSLGIFSSGVIPGTPGLRETDAELPANIVRDPTPGRVQHFLSNSFGFGGQNCALIVAAP